MRPSEINLPPYRKRRVRVLNLSILTRLDRGREKREREKANKRPDNRSKGNENEKVERKIKSIVKNNYIFDEQKYAQKEGKN